MPESRTLPWCLHVASDGDEAEDDEGRTLADAVWDPS